MDIGELTRRIAFGVALSTAGIGVYVGAEKTAEAQERMSIEEVTSHNFIQRVYQNSKPVVVLFYEAEIDLKGDGSLPTSRRMEKVVEALADKYPQIDFFKVAMDHNDLSRSQYERVFGVPDTSPLTVIYARSDVLTGREYDKNVRIDVSKGGPKSDRFIQPTFENCDYWIQQNIFGQSPDGDRKLYRYEGTLKIHEVGFMQ